MRSNKLNLFLLILPAIFAFLFKAIFREYRDLLLMNMFVDILGYLVLVPLLFSSVIKSVVVKKHMFLVITVVSALAILFECLYYNMYKSILGPSTIYFMLETSESESLAFFQNAIDFTLVLLVLVFLVLGYVSYKAALVLIENFSTTVLRSNRVFVAVYCLFMGVLGFILHKYDDLRFNAPYLACKSIFEYQESTEEFEELGFANNEGYFENVERPDSKAGEEETFVVIIGESTTRQRMSLYGYAENTNPRLNEIKEELDVFNDVITPHIGTILSLGKALTTNSVNNTKVLTKEELPTLLKGHGYKSLNENVGSVVQLYNTAGFKTFWLSNHPPIGLHGNLVTEISKGADVQEFINVSGFDGPTPYDGALLPPLEKALADNSKKKVIFLHLLGTHTHYEYRYPKEFDHFEQEKFNWFEKIISKQKMNKSLAVNYDNAVRYNDYVVNEVIERVREKNESSYVLYFSDHGEDVDPEVDSSFGRSIEEPTRPMFEVPMVLWRSPKLKQKHQENTFDLNHKFMLDDLIHAIADISDIDYSGFRQERSIFNTNYCEIPRIVLLDKEFDEEFGNTKEKKELVTTDF